MSEVKLPDPMQVYNELNKLRRDPVGYASVVEKYMGYFEGNVIKIPGKIPIRTMEGAKAFQEAIDWLKQQKPVEPLLVSKTLEEITEDYRDIIVEGGAMIGLTCDMDAVIEKRGEYSGEMSRAMELGGENHEEVIVNLLVSDGDKYRLQRKALMNSNVKRVGVACGPHKKCRTLTCIILCTKIKSKGGSED